MKTPEYPFVIQPLAEEDGGGWMVTFPDLPGCTADGDSIETAVLDAADAEAAWLAANRKWGGNLPQGKGRVTAQLNLELLETLNVQAIHSGLSPENYLEKIILKGLESLHQHPS